MTERIQEFVDSRNQTLRLNRQQGVLAGVKLIGLTSRNGRTYREPALAKAAKLYEGVKVNVNHPKGSPQSPRDYQDRLGSIRNVRYRPGEGLFGDLHFNPKHALAEQLLWDAEHSPKQVGLSHNVLARTTRSGDSVVVEEITTVESVDLVADPATTEGLFEAKTQKPAPTTPDSHESSLESLTLEQLSLARPDLLEQVATPIQEALQAKLKQAGEQIAQLQRQGRIVELLTRYGLPLPGSEHSQEQRVTSKAFVATLAEATTDEALEARIADRAAVVQSLHSPASPLAREQTSFVQEHRQEISSTPQDFAKSLKRTS